MINPILIACVKLYYWSSPFSIGVKNLTEQIISFYFLLKGEKKRNDQANRLEVLAWIFNKFNLIFN